MSNLSVSDAAPERIPMPDGSGHLAYRRLGWGPTALLTFHGFGQDSHVFDSIGPIIGEKFTVFAVDMFFHGQSQLDDDRILAKSDWWMLIDGLLDQENIKRFSILGFSLGGRLALTTLEAYASRIEAVYLIAPDGITRSWFYELATGSEPGRWLFKQGLRHLPFWNRVGNGLTRLGLLHKTALRFAENTLATPEQRQQLFRSWINFRRIQPELPLLIHLLNELPLNIHFYVGQQDRIVPPSYIDPLLHQLKNADLTTFAVGHNRLIEKVAESMAEQTA